MRGWSMRSSARAIAGADPSSDWTTTMFPAADARRPNCPRIAASASFGSLRRALADLLFDPARGTGLLINNHATVNAAAPPGERPPGTDFAGRLHGIVVADSADRTAALDDEVGRRLAALAASTRGEERG